MTSVAPEAPIGFRAAVHRLAAAQKPAKGAPAYSRFVNRRLGRLLAAAAHRLGLRPNQVTAISAVFTFTGIGVLALAPLRPVTGLAVTAALVLGYALDAADGQLARLRGGGSLSGEWLDHMVDALKIATLHSAVLISLYRRFPVGHAWALVPLGFSVVAVVAFFAMLLNEQLRRHHDGRPAAQAAPAAPASTVRSLLVAPTDYGVLCLSFLLLGAPPAFLTLYGLLFAGSAGYLLLAVVKWYREIRELDRAGELRR